MLKDVFKDLIGRYSSTDSTVLWNEIEKHYSESHRHYHNLTHLENIYSTLSPIKNLLEDWDTILFSLFYHDVIYNPSKSDNEERSAELAIMRVKNLNLPDSMIERCKSQILATKKHFIDIYSDTNYFTDADLSILGQTEEIYFEYVQNIRKEYKIYPSFIYNLGRKKVVNHFLKMEKIFKTDYFYANFEEQAKQNLTNELHHL